MTIATLTSLQSLVAQGESETLCAFLNGEGGKVLIGVGPITLRNIAAMLDRFEPTTPSWLHQPPRKASFQLIADTLVQVAEKAFVGWVTVELDLADRVLGLFDAAREMRRQFGVTRNSGCRGNGSLREAAELGFQHRLIHRFAREGHAARHFAWQARQRSSLLFCWRQPAPMLYGFDPIHHPYFVTLCR